MCCDCSPAVFSQRYNFPREQVWRQLPRLAPLSALPPPHKGDTPLSDKSALANSPK